MDLTGDDRANVAACWTMIDDTWLETNEERIRDDIRTAVSRSITSFYDDDGDL